MVEKKSCLIEDCPHCNGGTKARIADVHMTNVLQLAKQIGEMRPESTDGALELAMALGFVMGALIAPDELLQDAALRLYAEGFRVGVKS